MKDKLRDLNIKLNLLEDQQAKDKQSIIETLNSQYTDVILAVEGLQPEKEPAFDPSKYYERAKDIVMKTGKASATLLQRSFQIGYAHAAGILDYLEEQGIVGPYNGAKSRKVLIKSNVNEKSEKIS